MDDTIAAIATPPGRAAIGIVRISGSRAKNILASVTGKSMSARRAIYATFRDGRGTVVDTGIALYFPGPNTATGEDLGELHGHGSPVVMQTLLQCAIQLGARQARPGEFSERAFLNGKLDLVEAEAIADLIASATDQAARSAVNSLQGVFSRSIHELQSKLTDIQAYVEAAIDFPDEEIDLVRAEDLHSRLAQLLNETDSILQKATQGRVLRDGLRAAIIGAPNVGKSSILNRLTGSNTAIVTDIPGTTRDLLRQEISIDGLPIHVIDTAGLRETSDPIEVEGIRRTKEALAGVDQAICVDDPTTNGSAYAQAAIPDRCGRIFVHNKIDLMHEKPRVVRSGGPIEIYLSARTGEGIELLTQELKNAAGYCDSHEGSFSARQRHIDALQAAREGIEMSVSILESEIDTVLLAEQLRRSRQAFAAITGEFTSEDLLDTIFRSFCIGK